MLNSQIKIVIILLNFLIKNSVGSNYPEIQVNNGRIKGKLVGKYYAFQGIPYAEPPIGELRFKPPLPAKNWSIILDATQEENICPQERKTGARMSENCLFLNVYTPSLGNVSFNPYATMFWVHGGELSAGSGNTDVYGPDFIVKENVIVVTINYRLGVFGFLCTDTKEASGNVGLKDVVLALKWVSENIHYFGGTSSKITVAGESAGAVIVHYLLLSDMSNGLFQQAIMSSGSVLGYRFFTNSTMETAFELGKTLGHNKQNATELVNFLKTKTVEEIITASQQMRAKEKKGATVYQPFVPCLEKKIENQERFLTDYPLNLIKSGKVKDVPIIAGFNTDEGMKILPILLNNISILHEIENDFQRVVPPNLGLEDDTPEKIEIARLIKEFYMDTKPLDEKTMFDYLKIIGDGMFLHPIDYWLRRRIYNNPKALTYYYEFSFNGSLNYFKLKNKIKYPGCSHADDLGYLWLSQETKDVLLEETEISFIMRERFITLWTNFIKTGNPTIHLSPNIEIEWQPVDVDGVKYLKISNNLEMLENPYRNRTLFWENIYNLPTQGNKEDIQSSLWCPPPFYICFESDIKKVFQIPKLNFF